jgi:hypothetical protein
MAGLALAATPCATREHLLPISTGSCFQAECSSIPEIANIQVANCGSSNECAPLALLIEHAGGAASNGMCRNSTLKLVKSPANAHSDRQHGGSCLIRNVH